MAHQLYQTDTLNLVYKNGLAVSFARLGETHATLRNKQKALIFFEKYHQIAQQLYQADTLDLAFKQNLSISYQFLGKMYISLGNLEKALAYFATYNRLNKQLYKTDTLNLELKHSLAISYQFLGLTYTSLGNLEKALIFFEKYNQIAKELYKADAFNLSYKNDLAISYQFLGNTHSSLGNFKKALTFIEKDIELSRQLYETDGLNLEFKNNLSSSYLNLSSIHSKLVNKKDKLRGASNKKKIQKKIIIILESSPNLKDDLNLRNYVAQTYGNLSWNLLFGKQFKAAAAAAKRGLSLDHSEAWIYTNLAPAFLFQGKKKKAMKIYKGLKNETYADGRKYKEVFLGDLKELEAAGITHPDVDEIKAYLRK